MGYMYDRQLDNGQGQVEMTQIPLNGSSVHVTQFDPLTNTRWSWEANGQLNSQDVLHYTNQSLPYGHPNRHNP